MANIKVKRFNLQPNVHKEEIFNLLEKQIQEKAQVFGRECYFFKQSDVQIDEVFLESISQSYRSKNVTPMYYLNDDDSADLDGSMVYGGFNMIPLYSKIIYIPVRYFKDNNIVPQSHDLIFIPEKDQEAMLFEIVKDPVREQDRNNSKNGRIFAYKLFLKLYSLQRGNDDFEDIKEENITDVADESDKFILDELAVALDSIECLDKPETLPETTQTQKQAIKKKYELEKTKKGRFENL